MKHYLRKFLIGVTLFLSLATTIQASETYTFDPMHTYVLFHVNHFGFSNPSGKWFANGTLTLDKDKPQNSKVNATIKVSDIITGIDELDKHLKGKLFFDVDQFPMAAFVSNKVEMTGKNTANVQGVLTVHGISKPVTLNVHLNNAAMNPITNKMTVGFTATTEINRSDFGMMTLLPGVSDKVKIEIEAEAAKN